jgi:hypothetical protein
MRGEERGEERKVVYLGKNKFYILLKNFNVYL